MSGGNQVFCSTRLSYSAWVIQYNQIKLALDRTLKRVAGVYLWGDTSLGSPYCTHVEKRLQLINL